jgi:hypothetical protein
MPDTVRMIKSKWMTKMAHVTRVAERINEYRYKYLEERKQSQDLSIDVGTVFVLKKYNGRVLAGLIWLSRYIPERFLGRHTLRHYI